MLYEICYPLPSLRTGPVSCVKNVTFLWSPIRSPGRTIGFATNLIGVTAARVEMVLALEA